MDSTSSTENDAKDGKYDPMVLHNTLHKHLLRIVDTIEPQKKHGFLDILLNSLNSILTCFKCKSTLKENSASFNCGHKYCEQCVKNLKKCTSCNEGTIRTDIRNFSNILIIVNEIKSNFNSDKVIYEMMRYLLMPQKFSHVEEVVKTAAPNIECTPCDSSLVDNVNLRKSRKSAFNGKKSNTTTSASKNSRKKLEFNKELNRSKNSTNTTNSDCSFFETATNKKKINEKRKSYLELQPPVMDMKKAPTPVSKSNRKRKNSESYLELQPAISEMSNVATPVSNNKRKRKMSDGESSDRITGKSKRVKTRSTSEHSLIEDEKSECGSLRKRSSRKKLKSPLRSSDSPKQGIFSGFDNRQSIESFNKLEVLLNCFDAERHINESRRSKKLSSNVDVLSATGEENQQNVPEQKKNPIFDVIKRTVDEVKIPFIPTTDVDPDALDLDVWKNNDRYKKKKNLFKSVKERNKRSISIGGSLGNLLEPHKLTPTKQLPIENDEMKKVSEMDLLKDEKVGVNDLNSIDAATKKKTSEIEEILDEPVSKFESPKNRIRKQGSLQIMLQRITPKKQSPVKLDDNPVENGETKKVSEIDFLKDKKVVDKDLNSIDATKGKTSEIEEILEEPVSKIENKKHRIRKQGNLQIMLQRISPKKQSPMKLDSNAIKNIKVTKDSEILFPNDEKKLDKNLKSIITVEEQKISINEEVLKELAPKFVNMNNEVGKEPTKISQEIEKSIDIQSISTDHSKKEPIKAADVEEPPLEEETVKKSREILAEITDHQQNAMTFGNSTEKHKTPLSSTKSDTFANKRGKLGLPLFPETNSDVFSQKGNLCSSTPCVGTSKKVTKTYSRAKNSLFNKSIPQISPIAEEKNFEDVLTFADISPIVEKVRSDDDFIIISDEIASLPKDVENRPKSLTTDDSQEVVTGNMHVVVAEVHEIPVTPETHVTKEIPKLIQSEKQNESFETIPVKNSRQDEIIPMKIDNVIEAVDKVTDNILSKTSESVMDLEDEIQPVDSDIEHEAKRSKVKKLQESINNKTEKTLSSLKKNFNKSSSKLSVEKFKSSPSSTTPAKNARHFSPIKSSPPRDQKEINGILASFGKSLSNDYHDAPTQKRCTPTKSVACQTSPDLHLALLKQEFPHLFEKYTCDSTKKNYPLSVYDTPTEPINEGVKITAKTPDIRLLNTTAKFTRVSSITSSEKKRVDEQFMNESVLGNESFNVISANKTTNISDYTPLSPQTQNGKKKLSCRLNFDGDDDEERPEDAPPIVSTESDEDLAIKNAPDFSVNRSNEIDFSDDINDKKEEEVILSASILENSSAHVPATINQSKIDEDVNKTFFEFDKPVTPVSSNTKGMTDKTNEDKDATLMVIPDTDDMGLKNDDDKNQAVTDDDDDVDFVAGTPTSQPRRLLTENLEKLRTPRSLLRKPPDLSLHEFSIIGNTTPNMSSIRPLSDVSQYSMVKKPTPAEVTPIDEPSKKKETDAVSLELFNSSVSVFSPASEKIFIATSGLKEPDVNIIKEFCKKFSATYVDKLTDESTHLVVKTNNKNRSARTFKYLQAIVSRIRIVSMKWIHECLTKEKLVNEEKFIPCDSSGECGPLRTFHVIKNITPSPLSWLNEYCIYFTEPVPQECTLDQLQSIMRKAGAVVVNSMREFKMYPKHHHVIIVSDDEDCDDEYNMKIAGWLQSYEAVSLEFNWILEVIGRNRLMPFADFEVIEIPNEYLLQRNFPLVMLQSNEEDQNSSD